MSVRGRDGGAQLAALTCEKLCSLMSAATRITTTPASHVASRGRFDIHFQPGSASSAFTRSGGMFPSRWFFLLLHTQVASVRSVLSRDTVDGYLPTVPSSMLLFQKACSASC